VQDLLLLRVREQIVGLVISLNQPPQSWRDVRQYHLWRWLYYVAGLGVIVFFGWERQFLIYWLLPYFTWLKVILRWRSIAEHFGIENDGAYTLTRTTYPYWWERLLVTPKHANFHLDHHLYPSVPFFRLPQLHAELMKIPNFARTAHVTFGYWGVLRECLQTPTQRTHRDHHGTAANLEHDGHDGLVARPQTCGTTFVQLEVADRRSEHAVRPIKWS
jgi:fatty acid desaturase